MIALAALLELAGVAEAELLVWIESGWVKPEGGPGFWAFHEVDVARVRLIAEFRHDLAIDDDTLPVVLSLLDQIYALRRDLGLLCGAVADQPEAVREAITAALAARRGG